MRWLVNAFSLNMLRSGDGRVDIRRVDLAEARTLADGATSAVGHADTAAVFASQLGMEVPLHRATIHLDPGDELLVGQLRGPRLPEGATKLPPGGSIVWCHLVCAAEAAPVSTVDARAPGSPAAAPEARGATEEDRPPPALPRPAAPEAAPVSRPSVAPETRVDGPTEVDVNATVPPPSSSMAPVRPPAPPQDNRSKGTILFEIRKLAAWGKPEPLAKERAALLARFPDAAAEADAAEADGRAQSEAFDRLNAAGQRRGPDSDAFAEVAREICQRWRFLRPRVDRQYEFWLAKQNNARRTAALVEQSRPLTSLRATGDHRILALPAAPAYTVLIDEAGQNFLAPGAPGREGRFVAIVLPEGVTLPALPPDFHASKETDETLDHFMQALLDHPMGVLGVTLRDLPPTPGERWVDGVLELVDWLLLLLPRAPGAPLSLDVRVEARDTFVAGQDWVVAARDLLRRHASRDPAAVADVQLQIRSFGKLDDTRLGYADLVAFTWNAGTRPSAARLDASGLRHRCLLEGQVPGLRAAWDAFARDRAPDGPAWLALVSDPTAADPLSIQGLLAVRLADRTRGEPALWERYLSAVSAHLDSKAIDLPRVGRALRWLADAAPDDATLPPLARHTWALARLAEANHLGATLSADEAMLDELGTGLLDEAAPAVCHADLHRAVLATNRFDFPGATRALSRWVDVDPRVPGLQMWGRVQSSLGQHLAFAGRHADAVARFDAALSAFDRLSDPRVRGGERAQTSTYRAIARMDDPKVSDTDARAALEAVIGPMDAALPKLAASTAPGDRYALHLLLRWAAHRGDTDTREALVRTSSRWTCGVGHPWPLIGLYRALLLESAGAGDPRRALREAVNAAWHPDQGPTVLFIGLVVATVEAARAAPDPRLPAVLELLRVELPSAADRLVRVEDELAQPGDAMAFVRSVLPFNFR